MIPIAKNANAKIIKVAEAAPNAAF